MESEADVQIAMQNVQGMQIAHPGAYLMHEGDSGFDWQPLERNAVNAKTPLTVVEAPPFIFVTFARAPNRSVSREPCSACSMTMAGGLAL